MFCSAKGCATISCRVMNCEQHETGLGEGGSRVITAGQPSLILINITTKRFAQEAGRRTGREPARPTQARARAAQLRFAATPNFRHRISPVGLQFPTWGRGTTTLSPRALQRNLPWQTRGARGGSAAPGWTEWSPLKSHTQVEHLP